MQFSNLIFYITLAVSAVVANPVPESSDGGSIMKRSTSGECYAAGYSAGQDKGCKDRVEEIGFKREAADELEKRVDCSDLKDYRAGYKKGYKDGYSRCADGS